MPLGWGGDCLETTNDDPSLAVAYEAKILKERSAERFVHDDRSMGAAIEVCGDRFTLADVFWAISLYRLKWLGMRRLFGGDRACPQVFGYAERVLKCPSFVSGVTHWLSEAESFKS